MSRVVHTLKMSTSLGPAMQFTLQASVPVHMLSKCTSALPRPSWEPLVYYSCVCAMAFLLFAVLVTAYFDADGIIAGDIVKRHFKEFGVPAGYDKSKIFDLRMIAGVRTPETAKVASQRHGIPEISNGHVAPADDVIDAVPKMRLWRSSLSFLAALFTRKSQPPVESDIQNKSARQDIKRSVSGANLRSTAARQSEETKTPGGAGSREPPLAASLSFAEKLFQFTCGRKQPPIAADKGDLIADKLDKPPSSSLHQQQQQQQRIINNNNINKRRLSEQEIKNRLLLSSFATAKSADHGIETSGALTELTFSHGADDYEDKAKDAAKKKHAVKRHDERKRRERLLELENEETSSTTTESSGADADDKNFLARDLAPEQPQPTTTKTQKLKKRNNKKEKKASVEDVTELTDVTEAAINEDEFIITSKSKAHKKIKIDPRNAFGGNILRPSTLELPYTTKLEVEAAAAAARDEQNKDAISSSSLAADLRKLVKVKKVKVAAVVATKGDLSELALQTEQFSKKLGKMAPLSPPNLVGGSTSGLADVTQCGGSYGSAVNEDGFIVKTRATPAATDAVGNIGQTFAYPRPAGGTTGIPRVSIMSGELKHPGTIGTKACGVVKPTSPVIGSLRRANPWNPNPGSPVTPDAMMFSNGLQPIKENVAPATTAATMQPNVEPGCNNVYIGNPPNAVFNGLQNGLGQFGFAVAGTNHKELTMMQKLQLERRQRLVQYQNNLMKGEDWPGFGMAPVQADSLWDTSINDPWAVPSEVTSPVTPKLPTSSWEALGVTASVTPTWAALPPSIWGNSTAATSVTDSMPYVDARGHHSMEASPEIRASPSSPGGDVTRFDPFSTMGSIWNPTCGSATGRGGNSGSPWGFPPKPDHVMD